MYIKISDLCINMLVAMLVCALLFVHHRTGIQLAMYKSLIICMAFISIMISSYVFWNL